MSNGGLGSPFILMGPPRAGSTFLAHVLDVHPQITCTDEARPFMAAARALRPLDARSDYGIQWEKIFVPAIKASIIEFYEGQGVEPGIRWGDKFPHYADPTWGAGILETIDRLFPETLYIFLTRNREAVCRSMQKVNANHNWLKHSPEDIYNGIHRRADDWERKVKDRMVRISYDDGLQTNVTTVLKFLGLEMASELRDKIFMEGKKPTRYSSPTSW